MIEAGAAPDVRLEESWRQRLLPEFSREYMQKLRAFLKQEKQAGKQVYPPGAQIFNALDSTPFDKVSVVILGQDPYHNPGQAHGLCFSVQPGVEPPPSLVNIYKELNRDTGFTIPQHGCLTHWARQGVLLLNATLTVERFKAASHAGKGWELFTDRIVALLNEEREGLVFLLWGSHAQKKGQHIDRRKHLVLEAPHPSPLSAHRGFLGCGHFSKTNVWLRQHGRAEIDWQLPQSPGV
jgi:uracil-DNA glycosylase